MYLPISIKPDPSLGSDHSFCQRTATVSINGSIPMNWPPLVRALQDLRCCSSTNRLIMQTQYLHYAVFGVKNLEINSEDSHRCRRDMVDLSHVERESKINQFFVFDLHGLTSPMVLDGRAKHQHHGRDMSSPAAPGQRDRRAEDCVRAVRGQPALNNSGCWVNQTF